MKMNRSLNGVNGKGRTAMVFDLAARRRIARITNLIFADEAAKGNKYVYRLGGMDISELEQMPVNSCRMYNFNDLLERLKIPAPGRTIESKLNKKVILFKFDFGESGVNEVTNAIQDCKELNDLCEKRNLPARGLAAAFMKNFGMVKAVYMPSKVAEIPYSFLLVNKALTKKDLMHELIHVIQEFTGLSIAPDFTDSFKKRNVDDGYGGLLFNQSEIIPYFNSIMYEFDEKLIEPKKMTVDELWNSIEEYRKLCVSKTRSEKTKPTKFVINDIVSNPSDDMQKSLSTPDRHMLVTCFVHGQYVSMFGKIFDNYFKDKDIDEDIKNDEDDGDESWYVRLNENPTVKKEELEAALHGLIENGKIGNDVAGKIVNVFSSMPEEKRTGMNVAMMINVLMNGTGKGRNHHEHHDDPIMRDYTKSYRKYQNRYYTDDDYFEEELNRKERERMEMEWRKKTSIEYAVDTDDLKKRIEEHKNRGWYNDAARDAVKKWFDRNIRKSKGDENECERLRRLKKQYLGQ